MTITRSSADIAVGADQPFVLPQITIETGVTMHDPPGNSIGDICRQGSRQTTIAGEQADPGVPFEEIMEEHEDVQPANVLFGTSHESGTATLLQKIELLSSKVNDLDQKTREKGNNSDVASGECMLTDHCPQKLVLQAISAAAKATSRVRSFSEARDNYRAGSISEDLSFLGPADEASVAILEDTTTEQNEVIFLKSQLTLTLQVLETLRQEASRLRHALAIRAALEEPSHVEIRQFDLNHIEDVPGTGRTATAHSTIHPTAPCTAHSDESHIDTRVQQTCPKVEFVRRQVSPLPFPQDPGVSNAFLRGTLNRPNSSALFGSAAPRKIQTPLMPIATNMERRQSEPCLTVPTSISEPTHNISISSSYMQPGTTNTPSTNILPSLPPETRGIWASTPDLSRRADSATDTESMQDKSDAISYRRIMERNTEMNWATVVDKIVYTNDQQASVALQQKLKIATTDHKGAIVDAIILQAFPLMINKFGNFLIQKCFEHGTMEQIDRIASAIKGNVLILSKDAFGCHVVQKALDNVSEAWKATFVAELLSQIRETVTHRYACHVWQKLFEVRWTGKVPDIMSFVNAELKGLWDQVALEETGSLVVQNIFENCIEEERRPCTDEVLANVERIIRGQWGNWVIQHIVEHGAELDRETALNVVMVNAIDYSVDQYASKVIEKAIKSGNPLLMSRYLSAITQAPPNSRGRTRMPLIDIASDQYGNYLIQYILTNGTHDQKTLVASHIRKHMVSMRGSRYGAKVAFTVERMRNGDWHDSNITREARSSHNRGRGFHHAVFSQRNNARSGRD